MIHHGDLFTVLPTIIAESIDACCTDPPYGIAFMGKSWDNFSASAAAARIVPNRAIASANPNLKGRTRGPASSPSAVEYNRSLEGQRGFQDWTERWAREVYRVLKPGAYLVVCGAPRSHHRMMCGLEDAGFVVRDCFAWLFLSGFPKSLNFGCKCGENPLPYSHDGEPQTECHVRRVRGADVSTAINARSECGQVLLDGLPEQGAFERGAARPESETSGREQPSLERRQLHRAGEGLSIDSDAGPSEGTDKRLCAGAHRDRGADPRASTQAGGGSASQGSGPREQSPRQSASLRLPSRTLDGGASERGARCARCGGLTSARGLGTALKPSHEPICIAWKPFKGTIANNYVKFGTGALDIEACRLAGGQLQWSTPRDMGYHGGCDSDGEATTNDLGRWPSNVLLESADVYPEIAPYLYVAKPSREERDYGMYGDATRGGAEQFDSRWKEGTGDARKPLVRNIHPTVKPVELMRWLVKLVTPLNGTVLDPFTGSGTTGMACRYEQRGFIGIEREAEYVAIAERRIAAVAPLFGDEVA